ncbi:Alpha-amylase precursor [Phycisphaerae bacterium RAS1]|nr:Alpha-amylase precursor [Phycisphaerae bacterium RAS1]
MQVQRNYRILSVLLSAASIAPVFAGLPPRPVEDEVFYQIMPIAWRDSNNDAQRFGDFGGLTASLDYLENLGVTAVWLNPIFPSPAYHGYQHGDASQLNSWFGNEAGFLDFVSQAHARGIKVFLDLVCYGVSHNSPWFLSAFNHPESPYDTWLAFTNGANTSYQGYTYNSWNGSFVGFIHWDLRTAAARDLVTNWSRHWLDPNNDGDPSDGIDGYRLDHVWVQYGQGPDGWGYNLDDFWTPWKASLQQVNPDVFTFAEQHEWGSYGAEYLTAFDAAFTIPFMFSARDAVSQELAAGLYGTMGTAVSLRPADRNFLAILGNHDVDRVASAVGAVTGKHKLVAAILLTQPMPPVIYYGDELGMRGVKSTTNGSDANDIPMREPFKWNAVAGPPMSNYFVLNTSAYANRYERDNDGRSVQEQEGISGSLLEEYRALIAARHAHAALRRGSYTPVTSNSTRVWSFLRHVSGAESMLVAINLRGQTQNVTLDLSTMSIPGGSSTVRNILTNQFLSNITTANQSAYSLSLPAYGYVILANTLIPPALPASRVDGVNIPADLGQPALAATQNNATGLGDNQSELNQLFVRRESDGLIVGVTGNLAQDGTGFVLTFDSLAGGQNVLDTENVGDLPNGLAELHGLQFDAGFAPDRLYFINTFSAAIYVDAVTLPTGSGATKVYRGQGAVGDGDGLLSGGANPDGMQVAMNNSNTAGVTASSAAGAASATSGFELFVPYADLGIAFDPDAPIAVAAFVTQDDGSVSNQWLPGLGGGFGNLGLAPNLNAIAGEQYALAPAILIGDTNCDGSVNVLDINPFTLAISDPPAYAQQYPGCPIQSGDVNGDGDVDVLDINPFAALLVGK